MDEPRLNTKPPPLHNKWWGLKFSLNIKGHLSGLLFGSSLLPHLGAGGLSFSWITFSSFMRLSTNIHHIEKKSPINTVIINSFINRHAHFFIELLCLDIISGGFKHHVTSTFLLTIGIALLHQRLCYTLFSGLFRHK